MCKKKTREEFIEQAKKLHGDKYDYSLVEYINATTNVKIICPIHGEFPQIPNRHLNGSGCSKCANLKQRSTREQFIEKAKKIHGDKYDYSLVEYINCSTNVKIICPIHGVFPQSPNSHLSGSGCSKCAGKEKSTTEEFIEKAKGIHGDKYDYSLVEYINNSTNVKIICPIHGEFPQSPISHLSGSGCSKCAGIDKLTREQFIEKAKKIHGDKYDYSLVEYINNSTNVKIICPIHGVFPQNANSHLRGSGCSKCYFLKKKSTTEEFIEKAKKTHGDKYDYSLVEYINCNTNVKIICPIHGEFPQIPNTHLNGSGCSKCAGRGTEFLPFPEARDYVRSLKLQNTNEWQAFCKSGLKPANIPSHPGRVYKKHFTSLGDWLGTKIGHLGPFTNFRKLELINNLEFSDLLYFDPIELQLIINQGKLPSDFSKLIDSNPGSEERMITIQELKEQLEANDDEDDVEIENDISDLEAKISQVNDVDSDITDEKEEIKQLPNLSVIKGFHSLDNIAYAGMDVDTFETLIQYRLRLLWNKVLNGEILIEQIQVETGGKYFTMIKDLFFDEYNIISNYNPPIGYSFPHKPNLMQKLTVHRLIKNKAYGNWSGTGAGKTLSFIISSRELDSRLTMVVALNSTITQTAKSIKETYPDSKIFTEYTMGQKFDESKHNYLILNYEKFQQEKYEKLFQDLTKNNNIDFVVIDEVHNAKQRTDKNESIRRGVLSRLLGRVREDNHNLHVLAMSATPVINNIFEAKSLLSLLTGLSYDDIGDRRSLSNAIAMFKALTLNGLRFMPKYEINVVELTGHNTNILNVDGTHLMDDLLASKNYIKTEKLLLPDKLKAIKGYLQKGVVIYSYFTEGFIDEIQDFARSLGFKTATYTGNESIEMREINLNKFKNGEIDILIGSKPISIGVDGLQGVCNRLIIITLPWTNAEYEHLKGRIYRQGSIFDKVEIIIPQIKIKLDNVSFWSWDVQRLNLIKNKKTLADAVVDGFIPSKVLPTPETMHKKAIEALINWKNRVSSGEIISKQRPKLEIELYPEIVDYEQRKRSMDSELSEFNRRGKIMRSENMHDEFTKKPESFFRYHALRKERMEQWEEIPYEYIATKIKNKKQIIADFGCGDNKFKNCLSNKVYSFDHVAFDETVVACDMKNTPLENESIDVAMFSLSLWGSNYEDYIKEAHRVLNHDGIIYIAEPSRLYETDELRNELKDLLLRNGFEIVGDIEDRGKFIYLKGLK